MKPGRNPISHRTIPSHPSEQGVVLILALLITGALVASGLFLANRAFRNFVDTRGLYQKTPAFYAAESGAERSLFIVKRGRADPTASLCTGTTCSGANDVIPLLRTLCTPTPCTLGTGPTYTVSNNTNETTSQDLPLELSLKQNQSIVFGFFPQDTVGLLEGGTGAPKQIRLTNAAPGSPMQDTHAWIELRWAGIEYAGLPANQFRPVDNGSVALRSISSANSGVTIVLTNPAGTAGCVFSGNTLPCSPWNYVSVRALFADIQRLRMEPLSDAGAVVRVPNRVLITSRGTVGSGTAAVNSVVTVSTSWRLPPSNLFDYTLFSEGDITK